MPAVVNFISNSGEKLLQWDTALREAQVLCLDESPPRGPALTGCATMSVPRAHIQACVVSEPVATVDCTTRRQGAAQLASASFQTS